MILEPLHQRPPHSANREDTARLALGYSISSCGQRLAGQVSKLLMLCHRQQAADEFGIMLYHRVAPLVTGTAPPTHNVQPQNFRDQLVGLQRRGFSFRPLQEVLEASAHRRAVSPRTVVLTFDDGYESVFEYAWPVLRELQIPATVFLNTDYLDQPAPFPQDAWGRKYAVHVPPVVYRPLTTAQCSEMASSGLVELGAHTSSHADFRGQPDLFRRDLQQCLGFLRISLGIAQPTFAFPYGCRDLGYTDESLVEVVRELGIPCSLTTEAECVRLSDSPYAWGRFNIYDWDTPSTIAAKLLGYYGWAPRLGRLLGKLCGLRPKLSAKPQTSIEEASYA